MLNSIPLTETEQFSADTGEFEKFLKSKVDLETQSGEELAAALQEQQQRILENYEWTEEQKRALAAATNAVIEEDNQKSRDAQEKADQEAAKRWLIENTARNQAIIDAKAEQDAKDLEASEAQIAARKALDENTLKNQAIMDAAEKKRRDDLETANWESYKRDTANLKKSEEEKKQIRQKSFETAANLAGAMSQLIEAAGAEDRGAAGLLRRLRPP